LLAFGSIKSKWSHLKAIASSPRFSKWSECCFCFSFSISIDFSSTKISCIFLGDHGR
jgi:hypothetical protein